MNWSSPSVEEYADTLEEARKMKERLMNGLDDYYGDNVEDICMSDEPEERELLRL